MWSSVTERRIGTAGVSSTGRRLVRREPAQRVENRLDQRRHVRARTALLPKCAATISAVRARSSPRSMLWSPPAPLQMHPVRCSERTARFAADKTHGAGYNTGPMSPGDAPGTTLRGRSTVRRGATDRPTQAP